MKSRVRTPKVVRLGRVHMQPNIGPQRSRPFSPATHCGRCQILYDGDLFRRVEGKEHCAECERELSG